MEASGDGEQPKQADGQDRKAKQADDPPSLELVQPGATKAKRPAWADHETVKGKTLMEGDVGAPLFGFHLKGGAVEEGGVQIEFLAKFLESFRKVYQPLQAIVAGYVPQGNILPKTTASEPLVASLATTGSVTLLFRLSPEELEAAQDRQLDIPQLQTVKATGYLGALLSAEPNDTFMDSMQPFGKRVGRSYGALAEVLSAYKVETDWWSDTFSKREIEIEPREADEIADRLLRQPTSESIEYEVTGFMWEAATGNTKQRYVRIASRQRPIKASYDIPLTTAVTSALSHEVTATIKETAFTYPFAAKPHTRRWQLVAITKVGSPGGALKEYEQLELEKDENGPSK